ncbi:MAG: hypothetical protein M3Z87_03110 [Lactobacillus sp.]|nr:hypothetical protein [Lactobacillus sp.]
MENLTINKLLNMFPPEISYYYELIEGRLSVSDLVKCKHKEFVSVTFISQNIKNNTNAFLYGFPICSERSLKPGELNIFLNDIKLANIKILLCLPTEINYVNVINNTLNQSKKWHRLLVYYEKQRLLIMSNYAANDQLELTDYVEG